MRKNINKIIILGFLLLLPIVVMCGLSPSSNEITYSKNNSVIEQEKVIEKEDEQPKESMIGRINATNFINPKPYETIVQLYSYTINISINRDLGGTLSIPNITIYRDPANREMNWTEMNGEWLLNAGWYDWNLTIDPIDFPNGQYTVTVRTWSEFYVPETYFFNNTQIYIINNPPNVDFKSHAESSYIKTEDNQTILCNITNEEAINSVQWDLTTTLGVYNWKDMTYNGTAIEHNYEATYNMTDYNYDDYYLVVNATDDKNSSITYKQIKFTKSSSNGVVVLADDDDDDDDDDDTLPSILELIDEIWWLKYVIGGGISATVGITLKLIYGKLRKKNKKKKTEIPLY